MRFGLVVLAACYTGTPAVVPPPAPAAPVVIAVHAPRRGNADLVTAAALGDGGVIVVTRAYPGVVLGRTVECGGEQRQIAIVRFDAAGAPRWTRCVREGNWAQVVAAASDDGVWLVQTVDPNDPAHVHGDDRDLVVARHVTADGVVGDPRPIVVWHDARTSPHPPELAANSARNSLENLRLGAAAAAGRELIVVGATKAGAIVDGVWKTDVDGISMQGVVLAVPPEGPVRAIATSGGALFQDVAVAGHRYVAAGWCSRSSETKAPELFPCSGGLTAFAITGELDREPRVHVLGEEIYDAKVGIDADGTIAVAASAWRSPVAVEGATLTSTCSRFAFAASWTAAGRLRFARPLGDCTQRHASPYARDGQSTSLADDNLSEHLSDVADVAIIDHAPVVTIVTEETNHLDWPLRIDQLALSAPFGHAGAALVLDDTGRLVHDRVLRVDSRPAESGQPDTSLAATAGVGRVVVTKTGAHGWLVVEHGGSIAIDRRRFPLGSRLEVPDPERFGPSREPPECDAAVLRRRPDIGEMVRDIRDGNGEPDDFGCRRHVVAEVGIDIVPF